MLTEQHLSFQGEQTRADCDGEPLAVPVRTLRGTTWDESKSP